MRTAERDVMVQWLRNQHQPMRLMEVCGTHTAALYTTGLRNILPKEIKMLSGPGCPVCVTPSAYIDKLIDYAFREGHKVLTFGDMLQVSGGSGSLSGAKAEGGNVNFFYRPEDVLPMAAADPDTTFVLGAVGFETTAPVWATLIKQVVAQKIRNIKFLTALKTMPRALEVLSTKQSIDGFLCPGHVAVITGCESFREISEHYHKPMVVGGFTQEQLLQALCRLVLAVQKKQNGFWNEYASVVQENGNLKAQKIIQDIFTTGDATWRGFGKLAGSGLYLRDKYMELDAGSAGLDEDKIPPGCACGEVLLGNILSQECPLFGKTCIPEHPVGACMVSAEGSCAISFRNGGRNEN